MDFKTDAILRKELKKEMTESIMPVSYTHLIEKVANIPFQADLNLQLALSLHLIPLVKRIQYGTFMHNPLKDEIKSKLIMAYELAVKACVVINQRFNCTSVSYTHLRSLPVNESK